MKNKKSNDTFRKIMTIMLFLSIVTFFLYHPIIITISFVPIFIITRPRKLSETQKKYILENGILHFTTPKGAEYINEQKIIKASNRINSYCNYFRPSCFFFYKEPSKHKRNFNLSDKEISYAVKIHLTQNEISKFKYRLVDKALSYTGDFDFRHLNYSIEKK